MADLISTLKKCRQHLSDACSSLVPDGENRIKALDPLYNQISGLMDSVDDVVYRLQRIPNPSSD